jgi:hypothetical protein
MEALTITTISTALHDEHMLIWCEETYFMAVDSEVEWGQDAHRSPLLWSTKTRTWTQVLCLYLCSVANKSKVDKINISTTSPLTTNSILLVIILLVFFFLKKKKREREKETDRNPYVCVNIHNFSNDSITFNQFTLALSSTHITFFFLAGSYPLCSGRGSQNSYGNHPLLLFPVGCTTPPVWLA